MAAWLSHVITSWLSGWLTEQSAEAAYKRQLRQHAFSVYQQSLRATNLTLLTTQYILQISQ